MTNDLDKIEFVQAYFHLQFREPYLLATENLLRLRRNLRQAAQQVELSSDGSGEPAFDALFTPPVSLDPYARRRYQLPGPPFVIHPPKALTLPAGIDGLLQLPVVLFGQGILLLRELCLAFQALGTRGFHRGEGAFNLVGVEAEDLAGNRSPVWDGSRQAPMPLPIIRAGWWLDTFAEASAVRLQLDTPARLLAQGRPLFNPGFRTLFPFMLRRVTAMVHAHCGRELVDDSGFFLAAASRIQELDNQLSWRDWRSLEGDGRRQDLGGVLGTVTIAGAGLPDLLWLLRLATLLNLGKGASYGAGHLRLDAVP